MSQPDLSSDGSDRTAAPRGAVAAGRPLLDGTAWLFIVLAAVSAVAVFVLRGTDGLVRALGTGAGIVATVAPMIAVGLFLGGLTRELADPERIAPVLGERSGLAGLLLASALGAVTPGGPFAAFPIVYALFIAGADVGAVIAYLTAWSLIGIHRIVVWELPLLGLDFPLVRVLASLPLPIVCGVLARLANRGPLEVERPVAPPGPRRTPG